MKKAISLILAVCLVAAMAISASAAAPTVVGHNHDLCNFLYFVVNNVPNNNWSPSWGALLSADNVSVLDITEGTEETLTSCAQAITEKELVAVCEGNEAINNLTVFRQRNVTNDTPINISVKLWPCNPVKKTNQAVVVLFRAEGDETWSVVGYNNTDNVCNATLPSSGAYVVAMAW